MVKSPVRENRPPGSVRGAPGNRRPYRDPGAVNARLLPASRFGACVSDGRTQIIFFFGSSHHAR